MIERPVALALIAAIACAAAACRASEAGPTSGITPPPGWQALGTLATAIGDAAKQATVRLDGVEAWGDPARGCYGTWLGLTGDKGAPEVLAQQLIDSVSGDPALAGISVRDVVKPLANAGTDHGILSLAFTRAPHDGRLRAKIGKTGSYEVLACFWNAREPIACETACTQLLGSLR